MQVIKIQCMISLVHYSYRYILLKSLITVVKVLQFSKSDQIRVSCEYIKQMNYILSEQFVKLVL